MDANRPTLLARLARVARGVVVIALMMVTIVVVGTGVERLLSDGLGLRLGHSMDLVWLAVVVIVGYGAGRLLRKRA